jgi:hypothetical protein
MFILLARAHFRTAGGRQRGSKARNDHPAVFSPRYFSFDSRNENLTEKHIHQNYVWIAVPVRPSGSLVDRPVASAFAPKADK